jgi:chromosome partitioning protein
MAAADGVVVPLQPEDYGAQGISAVSRAVSLVQCGTNPQLRIAGYLLTMVNSALGIHQVFTDTLRAQYGAGVFDTEIPLAKDFKEAVAARTPVQQYKPRSKAAKSIVSLLDEIDTRLSSVRANGVGEAA